MASLSYRALIRKLRALKADPGTDPVVRTPRSGTVAAEMAGIRRGEMPAGAVGIETEGGMILVPDGTEPRKG